MRKTDAGFIFTLGFLFGVFTLAIAVAYMPNSYKNRVEAALTECQKELPRNQFCELIAAPIRNQ